jgi:hypothetical protein
MPEFQPSSASYDAREQALRTLKYARKAIEVLEGYLSDKGRPAPDWVLAKINQAAQALGASVTFVRYREPR